MRFFTSHKEKKLWLMAIMVTIIIFSTLLLGQPLQKLLQNQNSRAVFFLLGLLAVASTVLAHGLKLKPSKIELSIWIGIAAVYLMLFLRLGMPERSHLIEFSVLAVFIHKAIMERSGSDGTQLKPAIWALLLTFFIGVLDEVFQIFIPFRYFDMEDIVFNGLAALLAIGFGLILSCVKKIWKKSQ